MQCGLYNDTRDAIVARLNMVQASWGQGKAYYSNQAQPLALEQTNPLCRFKAVGYSMIPKHENSDGLVGMAIGKKASEVEAGRAQLVTSLQGVLGNKPGVSLSVETLLEDQEQWVTLQNVKHGDVLIKSRWLPSSPAPVSLTSTRAIVTLFLHCGENIGDVKRSAPCSRCEVRCGQEKRRVWVSSPRGPRHDPKYRQGCSFLSSDPGQDSLQLVVEDQRSGQSLGRVSIPLTVLIESPGNRINNTRWSLEAGTGEESSVTISAALLSY